MNEDKIISAILDLADSVAKLREDVMTKAEGRNLQHILEGHTTIMKNIQEDHTFSIEWIKRIQERVDHHDREILRLKTQLNIA